MAQVVYSTNAVSNLERAFAFRADVAPDAALAAMRAISSAVDMLEHHPLVGRVVRGELREAALIKSGNCP